MPGAPRLITREFLVLAASTMCFFAGMGASNPLVPQFVVDELGGTEAAAGVVMGSFAVSALLTRSGWGRMGDRRGARRLMVVGSLLGALGMVGFVVTTTVAAAVVARLVLGAGQAAVMTGSTVLAIDLAPESRRGEAASYILVAFHLGLGLGPIGGEALLDAASYEVVWVVLALTIASGAAVAMLLTHRPGDPHAPPSPWIQKAAIAPGSVAFFGIVAFAAMIAFVPLYAREIDLEQVGLVFTVASISIALVRILFGRAPDVLGPIRAGSIALLLTTTGAVILALWTEPIGVFVAAAVLAGGMSLQTPSLIPVAVAEVDPRHRGSAMATFTMSLDLSIAISGPLIGLIVSGVGYRAAFLTSGAMALVGLVLLHTLLAPRWRASAQPGVAPASGPTAAVE